MHHVHHVHQALEERIVSAALGDPYLTKQARQLLEVESKDTGREVRRLRTMMILPPMLLLA